MPFKNSLSRTAREASSSAGHGLGLVLLASLAACGGGGNEPAAPLASSVSPASTHSDVELTPVYRLAPVALEAPGDTDADGRDASGHLTPLALGVSAQAAALATAQAVPADMKAALSRLGAPGRPGTVSILGTGMRAQGSGGSVATVYTPAQIRAAYGFAQLPASTPANKGAYQGSGQTIYIVDAYHNPTIINDLAVFNQTFGLPGCSSLAINTSTKLPLAAAAPGSGCSFGVAYAAAGATNSPPAGALTGTAPAVNKSWVTEISLDVEWAHAMAPLARIVLIEARSSSAADLMAAVALAGRMGPGIVSMSFGAPEFAYASMQYWGTPLAGSAMSYVAAAGDSGSQANWPAVDSRVLAVGGTTLAWNGASRSEKVWSATGGAISKQVPVPSYQAGINKPGDPTSAGARRFRGSVDVAFNADPYSGQYTYVTPSAATGGAGWVAAGGTSISAPQWAGLLAIGNAVRALNGKPVLGLAQTRLYGNVAAVPGNYTAGFADITAGSNGSCGAMCKAATGYDLPTGLGAPNAYSLVSMLGSL